MQHLFSPGSKCERYEIGRLIGVGGMGEVYEAIHEFTRKPVAIKVLKLEAQANPELVEKMRAEATVMCRIKHDSLVEVYDAGVTEGRLIWMALERLHGESLRDTLARGRSLGVPRALEWAAQIAEGVAAAHAFQVVHRDLKPENVFITSAGTVKVLDFGTAKFDDGFELSHTAKSDRMGTVPYMSPEHLGAEPVDLRTDIYALGIIVYEMLAGRHPFATETGAFPPLDTLIVMQLTREPEPLTNYVGAAVWRVVERALAKNRDQRYATMALFAEALRGVSMQFTGESPPAASTSAPALASAEAAGPGSRDINVTPAPMSGGQAPVRAGMGRGTLVVMALFASLLGAIIVVFAVRSSATQASSTAPSGQPEADAKGHEPAEAAPSGATASTSDLDPAPPSPVASSATPDTTDPPSAGAAIRPTTATPTPPPLPPPPPDDDGEIFGGDD